MSYSDIAIRVHDVGKHYLLFRRPEDRLKESIVPRLRRLARLPEKHYYREFAALKGVSLDVGRGETVGIVGRNGSGKSTLLQIICGTVRPSIGTVDVQGRIAALLELGAGFNTEFTGRENVYLNSAILGLGREEIDARFDDIAAFADIGEFVDQPVKTYSSGMYVRLAFATAINVDPDILVVDEALAVGDEAFRRKCYARIEQIQAGGGTILFVSHSAPTVMQLCSRAVLIDGGELILEGSPKTVVHQYQRLINQTGKGAQAVRQEIRRLHDEGTAAEPAAAEQRQEAAVRPPAPIQPRPKLEGFDPALVSKSRVEYQSRGARIRDLRLLNDRGEPVNILEMKRHYAYEYDVDFDLDAADVGFGMLIRTTNGLAIGGTTTLRPVKTRLPHVAAGSSVRVRFEFECRLLPGTYFLNAGVRGKVNGSEEFLHRILDGLAFRVAPVENLAATALVDLGISSDTAVILPDAKKSASAR
jgi:homopolymeric O-antigen transport system ATP-binding protein